MGLRETPAGWRQIATQDWSSTSHILDKGERSMHGIDTKLPPHCRACDRATLANKGGRDHGSQRKAAMKDPIGR